MKARLLRDGKDIQLLCSNGTISNAPLSTVRKFFSDFDKAERLTGTDGKWDETYIEMSEHPGDTLAYITDAGHLVILDPDILRKAMAPSSLSETNYLTVAEYAAKHKCSKEMAKVFAREGRIAGCFIHGRSYFIPADAPYPVDEVSRKPTAGRKPYSDKKTRDSK